MVPTIRDAERLQRCIAAIRRATADDGPVVELVVVLDGAEPDVVSLASTLEGVVVVSWPERRGVAAALNAGIRATACPWVAIMQDDALPQPGWLSSLLTTALAHPGTGAVGGAVLQPTGVPQHAGVILFGDGTPSLPWVGTPPPPGTFTTVRAVDIVGTSSMLLARDAWASVGGFDEEYYPAYFVDADLCTALWHGGWFVLYDPASVVVHELHGSTSGPMRSFVAERGLARFRAKWAGALGNRGSGPPTPETVAAAIRRAEHWRDHPPWGDQPPARVARPPAERPAAEYQARERDFQRAYISHLEQQCQRLEAAVARSGPSMPLGLRSTPRWLYYELAARSSGFRHRVRDGGAAAVARLRRRGS